MKGFTANPEYAGLIGGELLRRFKVIFDYTHEWMILEPNGHFWEPFGENMSGLSLISAGPNFEIFKVVRVLEGSPGASAGLREGDILTAIDGKPVTKFTLEQVRQMFRQSGRRHLLGVRRGAKSLNAMITLKESI